jgi:hypothetical protein
MYMYSDYGVYPVPKTVDLRSSVIRFEEGEFVTSLTQAIHPPVVGSMVLNDFAHAAGLEVGSFLDDSVPPISVKMEMEKLWSARNVRPLLLPARWWPRTLSTTTPPRVGEEMIGFNTEAQG